MKAILIFHQEFLVEIRKRFKRCKKSKSDNRFLSSIVGMIEVAETIRIIKMIRMSEITEMIKIVKAIEMSELRRIMMKKLMTLKLSRYDSSK